MSDLTPVSNPHTGHVSHLRKPDYWTIDQIKDFNKRAGYFFFEPDTLRFFASRIGSDVFQGPGGVFFVTSEKRKGFSFADGKRLYSVRRFNPESFDIETAGGFEDFQAYRTGASAKRAARKLADSDPCKACGESTCFDPTCVP